MIASIVAVLAVAVPLDDSCAEGKVVSPDTAGNCCWPLQAWSHARSACVGVPQCPAGLVANGEDCVAACEPGKAVGPDTAGHCCWPDQVWAQGQQRCVGAPSCAPGRRAEGETCVAESRVAAPAPPVPAAAAAVKEVETAPEPPIERRVRPGLVIAGAIQLGVAYVVAAVSALGAAAYASAFPANACWRYAAENLWIPIIGPIVALFGQTGLREGDGTACTNDWGYIPGATLAVLDTIVQVAGLAQLIVGLAARETVVLSETTAAAQSSPHWFVSLGGPGTLGISVGFRGW